MHLKVVAYIFQLFNAKFSLLESSILSSSREQKCSRGLWHLKNVQTTGEESLLFISAFFPWYLYLFLDLWPTACCLNYLHILQGSFIRKKSWHVLIGVRNSQQFMSVFLIDGHCNKRGIYRELCYP